MDRRSKHLARSHPQGMRLPDFTHQTIIFLQSHKKKVLCFYLMCLAFFVCVQKTANQVIIYFILLRITITVSTTQKDDWGKQVLVRKLHTTSQSTKTLFSLTSLLVLSAFLKIIFMEQTQKSDEAKWHRFLEKTC